ncbi:MAG TPA: fibronectin type III domain-containing protein, partial [Anaeromyxobacter sp.]
EAGLRPGLTYCYVVAAIDGAGNRSADAAPACAAIPDVTPPTQPAGLGAAAISETEILLRWTASTDDNRVEGYEVLAAGGAGVLKVLAPAALVAGLRPAVEHCFTVRARDPAGNPSVESARACATPPDKTPPEVPPALSAFPVSDTEVRLAWNAPRDNVGVAGYEVRRDGALLRVLPGTALSDAGLKPATRHCYEVRAFDAAGNGSQPAGPSCATTPDLRPPSSPSRIEAAPAGGKIAVGWSEAIDDVGVVAYEVLRAGNVVARVAETSFVESGLEPRRWCYTVRALDAAGNRSPETVPACATAPDLMPPSPPSRLRATKVAETRADLRWVDSTDNVGVAGYEVLRGGEVVLTVAGAAARVAALAPAQEYCWTVRAFDAAGNRSAESERLCVSTPDETPPVLAGPLVAAAEVEDAVDLRWPEAADNVGVVGYELERDGSVVAKPTGTRFRDDGRRAGTRHCYAVRARDAAGHASAAATACLTMPDLTPPTPPSDLEAAPTDTQVALRWTEATDNVGVRGYEVLRGGHVVARVAGAVAVDARLAARTEHCYRVRALDAAGNRSAPAGPVCATTLDPAQPPAPQDVAVAPRDGGVEIKWSASPRKSVVYRVYAGAASIGATRYLTFAVRLRGIGERCFRITAVDEEGRESPRSKEACLAGVVEPASAAK